MLDIGPACQRFEIITVVMSFPHLLPADAVNKSNGRASVLNAQGNNFYVKLVWLRQSTTIKKFVDL